ncbi:hypothetical protein ONZ51_g8094 [Trametes cubensis]|uniref:RanBD1 domain-containing protein n=1 Tax=Trametes cubensis TaxID=1111947 RepID=A0AAD7TNY1_9APHY|nr:hypothetical protein ONZ51_g8094 [Trametes cubensis]
MTALDASRDPSQGELAQTSNLVDDQPQLSTPPSEANGVDSKTSRKREREVSLEPATPQATTMGNAACRSPAYPAQQSLAPAALQLLHEANSWHTRHCTTLFIDASDLEVGSTEGKDRRAPAKKNRTSAGALESTQEENEEEAGLSGSPPHETKIRQISQGVEDITWQNMKKDPLPEGEQKMDEDAALAAQGEPSATAKVASESVPEEQQVETPTKESQTEPQEDAQVPPLMQGENPPILDDTAGDLEDTGAAAGAEHPAESHVPGAPEPPAGEPSASGSGLSPVPETFTSQTPRLPPHRRDSDSDQEKGLKRDIPGRSGTPPAGATKRPRDDPEADPNTREKKRPTPPPDESKAEDSKPASASPSKLPSALSGFMAYASTSSPFASVKGQSLFGSKPSSSSSWAAAASQSSSSPFASASSSTSPFGAFASKDKDTSAASTSTSSSAHKRTGFEAFASVTSPFGSAAKRPKSPPPPSGSSSVLGRSRSPSRHGTPARATNAFSAYAAGGAQGFAAAASSSSKRRSGSSTPALGEGSSVSVFGGAGSGESSVLDASKDDDSEKDSGVSFGERLREAKDREEEEASDEEKKLNLQEQEVHTGEEEEETVYQVRGKLFTLSTQNQWKERGTGTLRLNVRREDGGGARLIMRKEAVYTVLLNATLFKGMRCFLAQDPRYIRFSVIEGSATTHYNLRVQTAKMAEELLEEINAHIPTE